MGLDGKTLIHPGQIDICNEVFAPTAEEVASARAIVEAFALPENAGKGVIQLNGKMVELLHADMARRTLAIADAIAGLNRAGWRRIGRTRSERVEPFPLPARPGRDALPQADERRACASRRRSGARSWSSSARRSGASPKQAMIDINHLLRPGHLAQLAKILDDPEATANDKFVAYDLLKNANIAAGGVLPMCQDTGTAIVVAKKGRRVWTEGDDEAAIAEGIRDAYAKKNLRYSQVAPLSMFEEKNTGDNLPAQIEIAAEGEDAYKFLFIAKGGGSANKTFLYQATPSILTHDRMIAFLKEKILTLGTAACPPYHLAIVIGGTERRTDAEDGQARLGPLSRRAADVGRAGRARLPRPRARGGDPQADAGARRRRAVRRQVFLPRRARDPPAAPRRLAADRPRRLLLGRPAGARQDHPRRRVPRGAGARSGALPAGGRRGRRSAARWWRSISAGR